MNCNLIRDTLTGVFSKLVELKQLLNSISPDDLPSIRHEKVLLVTSRPAEVNRLQSLETPLFCQQTCLSNFLTYKQNLCSPSPEDLLIQHLNRCWFEKKLSFVLKA